MAEPTEQSMYGQENRSVEVWTPGKSVSGYAIAPNLVLTSSSLVGDDCKVRTTDWVDGTVVWRGGDVADAALVRVSGMLWPSAGVSLTRWGRTENTGVSCSVSGWAHMPGWEYAEPHPVTATGVVESVSRFDQARESFRVVTPRVEGLAASSWSAMVGAAVLAKTTGQVLGVVVGASADGQSVTYVPSSLLLRDSGFVTAVGASRLEVVAPTEPFDLRNLVTAALTDLPVGAPDWRRLLPSHSMVEFIGRRRQLTDLADWCDGDERFGVGAITGDTGTGKTRLAVELCSRLISVGWSAGFLAPDRLAGLAGATFDTDRPILLVADEPEPYGGVLQQLATVLAAREYGPRVRLLTITRSGDPQPTTPSWRQLVETMRDGSPVVIGLNQHPLASDERDVHGKTAMAAFGGGNVPVPEYHDDAYRTPLAIHLATMTVARGGEVEPPAVMHGLIDSEDERWQRHWSRMMPEGKPDRAAMLRTAALIVLTRPNPDELGKILDAVSTTKQTHQSSDLARWALSVFGNDTAIAFGPDILKTALLSATPGLSELLISVNRGDATDRHRTNLLTALATSVDNATLLDAAFRFVTTELDFLTDRALSLDNTSMSEALAAMLARLNRHEKYRRGLEQAVTEVTPKPTETCHRRFRATHAELLTASLTRNPESKDADIAAALNELAAHASAAGRHSDAAQHLAEALRHYSRLDTTGAEPALASHNMASILLTIAGDSRQAVDFAKYARSTYEILGADRPELVTNYAECHLTGAICALAAGDLDQVAPALTLAVEIANIVDPVVKKLVGSVDELAAYFEDNDPVDIVALTPRPIRHEGEIPTNLVDTIVDVAVVTAEALAGRLPEVVSPSVLPPLANLADCLVMNERADVAITVTVPIIATMMLNPGTADVELIERATETLTFGVHKDPKQVIAIASDLLPVIEQWHHDNHELAVARAHTQFAYATAKSLIGETAEAAAAFVDAAAHYEAGRDSSDKLAITWASAGVALRDLDRPHEGLRALRHAESAYTALVDVDSQFQADLDDVRRHIVVVESFAANTPEPQRQDESEQTDDPVVEAAESEAIEGVIEPAETHRVIELPRLPDLPIARVESQDVRGNTIVDVEETAVETDEPATVQEPSLPAAVDDVATVTRSAPTLVEPRSDELEAAGAQRYETDMVVQAPEPDIEAVTDTPDSDPDVAMAFTDDEALDRLVRAEKIADRDLDILEESEQELRDLADRFARESPSPADIGAYAILASVVAKAWACDGRGDDGLSLVDDTRSLVDRHLPEPGSGNHAHMLLRGSRGHCHLELGHADPAITEFEAALAIDADTTIENLPLAVRFIRCDIELGLTRALILDGRTADARKAGLCALDSTEHLDGIVEEERVRARILSVLADLAATSGDTSEAIRLADTVISLLGENDPNNHLMLATAYFAKAEALMSAGELDDALEPGIKAVSLMREHADKQPLMMATILESAGNCRAVLEHEQTWPLLSEGTERMRALRNDGRRTIPEPLLGTHASACILRARRHLETKEHDSALEWMIEAVDAMRPLCPLPMGGSVDFVMVTCLKVVEPFVKDQTAASESKERLRALGGHIDYLVGHGEIVLQGPIARGATLIAAMSRNGDVPDELGDIIDTLSLSNEAADEVPTLAPPPEPSDDSGLGPARLWAMASKLRSAGHYDDAADCLRELVRLGQNGYDSWDETRLAMVQLLFDSGDTTDAILLCRNLLSEPNTSEAGIVAYRIWATSAASRGNTTETITIVNELGTYLAGLEQSGPERLSAAAEILTAIGESWR